MRALCCGQAGQNSRLWLREDPPGTLEAAKPQWGRRCSGCFEDPESEESIDHFWLQQEVSASGCNCPSLHGLWAPACGSVCASRPLGLRFAWVGRRLPRPWSTQGRAP